ncbi:MAG TPA: class I SAM-dependent methyltransferase [Pyrinomonadaceae bacterium]|nr:class I SAM-dependent methyltransferase [Pyrinomonadaceae bacterium]
MSTSFRDPAGYLFSRNGRIFRVVRDSANNELTAFLELERAREFVSSGLVVRTNRVDASVHGPEIKELPEATVWEHERIPFPSFPYEWPPEMLHAAGTLTLHLATELLKDGWGLKDATPYNILFRGPQPVFVDLLSFERRDPADPTWLPYAQFVRTFLLPLLVNKHFGLPLASLLTTHRDGLEPEQVYAMLSALQKIRPEFITLVSGPTWLGSRQGSSGSELYKKRSLDNPEKARFILGSLLKGLRGKLDRAAPEGTRESNWSDYMSKNRYTEAYFPEKEAFVREAVAGSKPAMVLDVGCNTGFFSGIAANAGASVISIDYDPVVVGKVWQWAKSEGLDIQPLVVDLTRPTPSIGWRNKECAGFLDRARGTFDLVLMLAVIHHMLVTERIPLMEIVELAAELTTKMLIIEFVAPGDQMFRVLTRGRDHLHEDLTVELFEATVLKYFEIVRSRRLGESERWIYLLRKKV